MIIVEYDKKYNQNRGNTLKSIKVQRATEEMRITSASTHKSVVHQAVT